MAVYTYTVTNDKLRQQAALSQYRSALQAPVQIIWGNGDKVKIQTIDNSMIHACKNQLSRPTVAETSLQRKQ